MSIQEKKANINGINTFYIESGQGELIVFLHGVPSYSYLWHNTMTFLEDNFRVIAPDLPGYAKSDSLPDYTLETYGQWLDGFCQFVGQNQKITLVVHDVGGMIGVDYALKYRDRIERLIITDTILTEDDLTLFMKLFLGRAGLWLYYKQNKTMFKMFLRNVAFNQIEKISNEKLDKYFDIYKRDKKERAFKKALADFRALPVDHITSRFGEIVFPTLIIWAEKDKLLPLSIAERMKNAIEGANLVTIENAGHFFQEEEPQKLATHVKEFIHRTSNKKTATTV